MPSFVRGIFAGALHDDLLFPFPASLAHTDPAEASTVRRLIAALHQMQDEGLIDSAVIDEQETIPDPTIEALAAHGVLGLTIPPEYGGLGLSATAYARVLGEVSRIDASLAVLMGVRCGLGSKAIVLYGTAEQKQRYLPALARGETLAAHALTEPDIGSDAQNIRTTATLSDEAPRSSGPPRSSSAPTCRAFTSPAPIASSVFSARHRRRSNMRTWKCRWTTCSARWARASPSRCMR